MKLSELMGLIDYGNLGGITVQVVHNPRVDWDHHDVIYSDSPVLSTLGDRKIMALEAVNRNVIMVVLEYEHE